jgi:hypothetical protein
VRVARRRDNLERPRERPYLGEVFGGARGRSGDEQEQNG